jgi:SPP1 gp7 family putative phage head morphogenesis protein
MLTVNEILRDSGISHALDLTRYTRGQVAQIMKVLTQAESDIIARIASTTGEWTRTYLEAKLTEIRSIYAGAVQQMGVQMQQSMTRQAEREVTIAQSQINDAIPEDLRTRVTTVAPSPGQIQAAISLNPADRGHTYGELLDTYSRSAQNRITAAVRQSIVEGETYTQAIQRLRGTRANGYTDGVFNGTRLDAQRIVGAGISHASNQARQAFYEANDDLVSGVQWHATLDTKTCVLCGDLDGQQWGIDEDHPTPPLHIGPCRCVLVPVLKSWRELGIDADEITPGMRAAMDGQESEATTYEDWLGRQSDARQDEILGPSRAELFRNGTSLDDMVDRGRVLTLDELGKAS